MPEAVRLMMLPDSPTKVKPAIAPSFTFSVELILYTPDGTNIRLFGAFEAFAAVIALINAVVSSPISFGIAP